MPEPRQDVLYHQPATRGLANPDGSKPIRYFGTVYRIPASEHGTIRQLEWETAPSEVLDAVRDESLGRRAADRNITERFEVIDPSSGDVWVMYRVPCEVGDGPADAEAASGGESDHAAGGSL